MRKALAFVLLLAACRVGEDYVPPELTPPERFAGASGAGEAEARWWAGFGDPLLDALIERALAQNLELEIAAQRIREARAGVVFVGGDARPRGDLEAAGGQREPSTSIAGGEFLPGDDSHFYSVGVDATWELDLFGHTARAVEAAEAERDALIEDGRAVLLSVLAEVARNYVELRGIEGELALVRADLVAREDTLALVRARAEAGLEDELDRARAEGQAAAARARLPELERERSARVHALGVLLGEWPAALAEQLAPTGVVPTPPELVPAALPADVLRRRPDVRRAERELARASAKTAEAITELYPRISLDAAFGLESEHLGDLFDDASKAFSVGPSLVTPLFRGGVLRAAIQARDAQESQAALRYQRAALDALREVEDALAGRARSAERLAALEQAAAAERLARELAGERYRRGLDDFLPVLLAERSALAAESELARERTAYASATILVYKALGGGWDELEGAAPALAAAGE